MLIVWRGWGLGTVLSVITGLGGVATLAQHFPGMPAWATNAGCWLAAAAVNAAFALYLESHRFHRHTDAATGEVLLQRRQDDLFFIPVRYWTIIFLGLAVLSGYANYGR